MTMKCEPLPQNDAFIFGEAVAKRSALALDGGER